MKNIEVDEELYQYIVTNTQEIGESASSILRRLLKLDNNKVITNLVASSPSQKEPSNTNNTEDNAAQGSIFDVINKEELSMQRGAVGRFLLILAALHRVHTAQFYKVCEIRGRDRLYFATNEIELEQSGSSTKPRQIPESNYWVITNSNTTRKKMMLTEVAKELGYSDTNIEAIRDLL